MIDRRLFLAGSALFCIGADDPVPTAAAQLDAAAKVDGRERLALLRRISRQGLSPALSLDVAAALRGAELELAIAKAGDPAARYAFQLRFQGGVDITPDALFAWCSRRVQAITTRLDRLLRGEGLTEGPVAERLRILARDPRYLYADSDAGRDRAVADMNRWLSAARAWLSRQAGTLPPAVDHVAVRRMTGPDEAAGKAGYRVVPSYDGAAPGAYFVDLHDIRRRPAWSLPSVVHHETLPGHLLQLPLQARAAPHPLRLRAASGFVEGWAFYAEALAADVGAFAQDGRAEIGYLQWMLFRLGRAMIDIGLHLRGWTADRAHTFLHDLQGDPVIFAPFDKDIAKARSDPASFAGQVANWRGFSLLRARAVAQRRDVRPLHDALLAHGAFPLALFARL
ncbi:DUF885 family protein [Sphingomonas sp. ASY06-1R]|uniref:DUF885 family protein n=1 Tax=Sphingomonas sp. ASY06-1R TaxID=3445771 RepID=UPI003FA1D4D7